MFKAFTIFLFCTFVAFAAQAESFTAKVNRNPIAFGETFVLTLQYDGAPGNSEPDLSPLNKNFNVHSVGRSAQHRNINGVTSNIYQWNVSLSLKVSSQVVIPSINFKSFSSQPITIKISDENVSGSSTPKFSIGRNVDKHNPLVQEQIIYTLVIKTTEEVRGDLPQFVDSGNGDWIIKQLDAPVVSSEFDNGIETRNITINYALFPQKSGQLQTPELQFNGYYIDQSKFKRGGFSDVFGALWDDSLTSGFGVNPALTRVSLTAQPLEIDVLPIPEINNGNWWLPSDKVEISSDWDNKVPEMHVGEAVNRKIKLVAYGVADTQLPKLSFPETPNLKQYPENPEYKSIVVNDGIVSEMSVNVVYIPQQGGQITIPEVVVPWYNLNTKSVEKAVLPPITAVVSGTSPVLSQTKEPTSAAVAEKSSNIEKVSSPEKTVSFKFVWGIMVLAFALGLFVCWLVFYFYHQIAKKRSQKEKTNTSADLDKILHGKDLKEVRNEILLWARSCNNDKKIINLDDVAAAFDNRELTELLHQLGTALYSGKNDEFDTKCLYKLIKELSKKHQSEKKEKPLLPELYK